MIFLSSGSLVCSVPWELFLTKKIQDQKNMPQIILKKRTAHLASYTFWHTGIPGLWTQVLDAGLWTLDSGRWTLDAGPWTLDSGR